jgi:hypothetical protein
VMQLDIRLHMANMQTTSKNSGFDCFIKTSFFYDEGFG